MSKNIFVTTQVVYGITRHARLWYHKTCSKSTQNLSIVHVMEIQIRIYHMKFVKISISFLYHIQKSCSRNLRKQIAIIKATFMGSLIQLYRVNLGIVLSVGVYTCYFFFFLFLKNILAISRKR